MANILIEIRAITKGIDAAFKSLQTNMQNAIKQSQVFQKVSSNLGNSSFVSGLGQLSNGIKTNLIPNLNRLSEGFRKTGSSILNFNNLARTATSASRAVGTSMIFAGGAFRDLGVAINVVSSLFQTVIPMFGKVLSALSELGPAGIALGVAFSVLTVHLTALAVAGAAAVGTLFKIGEAGIAFNQTMETTQISIATLITQFKDLYDAQGNQIGATKQYTDAQLKAMSATERAKVVEAERTATSVKLTAALNNARVAFSILSAEAAQSPFTTQELAAGFQSVVATLGQYGVTSKQAAELTVGLARVASVAGVSASNLASQFTLFLTGAGRITSPLSRFASALGLTKDRMKELREEFRQAQDDPVKTAAILDVLNTRLLAFDTAGKLIASSWAGIMSNMTESFELFAGSVTDGLFNKIRDAFLKMTPILNKETGKMEQQVTGALSKIFQFNAQGDFADKENGIAGFFTKEVQGAIAVFQDLYDFIGDDIATVINKVADQIIAWADWIGQNEDAVIGVYENFRLVAEQVFLLSGDLLNLIGITSDLGDMTDSWSKILLYVSERILLIRMTILYVKKDLLDLPILIETLDGGIDKILITLKNWGIAILNAGRAAGEFFAQITNPFGVRPDFGRMDYEQVTSQHTEVANKLIAQQKDLNDQMVKMYTDHEKAKSDIAKRADDRRREEADIRRGLAIKELTKGQKDELKALGDVTNEDLDRLGAKYTKDDINREKLRIRREKTLKDVAEERAKKNPNGDEGDGKGDKKKAADHKRVLDSLFKERRDYVEAEIDLEKGKYANEYRLATQAAKAQEEVLKNQLDEGEIAYSDYFAKLETLRQSDLQNDITNLRVEEVAERKNHELALEAFIQEELAVEAKYNASKKGAYEQADRDRDLEAIKIRRRTEELKFQKDINKLTAERTEKERESQVARLKNLIQERQQLREFFNNVRAIRSELDSVLNDPTDVDALGRAQDAITQKYAEQLKLIQAQKGTGEAFLKAQQSAIDSLAYLNMLERARLETQAAIARFKNAEEEQDRKLTSLEEKRNYGLLTETQYQQRSNILRKENIEFLRTEIEALRQQLEIAVQNKDLETQRNLRKEIFDLQVKLNDQQVVTEKVLLKINGEMRGAFKDFFGSVLDDVGNIGDAFLNLGKKIQKTFQDALVDRLLGSDFFTKILGNENQTKGRATGAFAWLGRKQGLDQDSTEAAKNSLDAFDLSLVTVGGDAEAFGEALKRSKDQLQQNIDARKAETSELNTKIDAVTTSINNLDKTAKSVVTAIQNFKIPQAEGQAVYSDKGLVIAPTNRPGRDAERALSRGEIDNLQYAANYLKNKGVSESSVLALLTNATREMGGFANFTNVHKDASNNVTNKGIFSFQGKYLKDKQLQAALALGNTQQGLKAQLDFFLQKIAPNSADLINADNIPDAFRAYGNFERYAGYNGTRSRRASNIALTRVGADHGYNPMFDINRNQDYAARINPYLRGMGPGGTPNFNPNVTGVGTGASTPVTITGIDPSAAQQQADALKQQVQDAVTPDTPENDDILTQIAGKLDSIVTSVGESGLGIIKTAVTNIDTKMGGGLSAELATFLINLSTTLTSAVTTPIVTALQSANLMSGFTHASNVEEAASGGYISGPGGPTEDKIPAWLSNGEYVIKAAAVKALGLDRLHALNNADKMMPQFGLGGFISNIFKSIGKFLTSDMGKLVLSTAVPMLTQAFFGEKAASAMALAMPFIFSGMMKPPKTEKQLEDTKNLFDAYKDPDKIFGQNGKIVGLPGRASGGLMRFAGGGLAHKAFGGFLPRLEGGGGGFWGSANGQAIQGGAINAALSIGMALIGRWQAKKAYKRQLEEYKKNRVKDPFGMNPETLTFYKKPIITGSRNWLAGGGPITSNMMLKNMPHFAMGGLNNMDLEDILQDVSIGNDSPMTVNQNINITTPDIHSFRNSRGQLERDLARVTQRGLKRRAPKY